MYIFADDAAPRYVTSVLPLDYDTMAVADKFGNVGVLRLPPDVSAQVRVHGQRGTGVFGCRRGVSGDVLRGFWVLQGCGCSFEPVVDKDG